MYREVTDVICPFFSSLMRTVMAGASTTIPTATPRSRQSSLTHICDHSLLPKLFTIIPQSQHCPFHWQDILNCDYLLPLLQSSFLHFFFVSVSSWVTRIARSIRKSLESYINVQMLLTFFTAFHRICQQNEWLPSKVVQSKVYVWVLFLFFLLNILLLCQASPDYRWNHSLWMESDE